MSALKLIKRAAVSLAAVTMATTGCSGGPNISVLPSSDNFTQNGNEITAKMDIIWVIDNSGSMQEEQQLLREQFAEFIKDFVTQGYDYKMTVISTDAWYTLRGDRHNQMAPYDQIDVPNIPGSGTLHPEECLEFSVVSSKFLDGNLTNGTNLSGFPIISSADTGIDFDVTATPPYAANNVLGIFAKNSNLGIEGCFAESGLRSMETALNDPGNAGFLRDDAHLAVIVVTDEEDQIMTDANVNLFDDVPIQHYHDFLTAQSPAGYSFHSIVERTPGECSAPDGGGFFQRPGERYMELSNFAANDSKGVVASICGDFAASLQEIAQTIIETTVEFKLTDTPVTTDGAGFIVSVKAPGASDFTTVAKDPVNGWSYNAERNSIVFNGTGIPAQGSEINIFYDPDGL